MLQLGDRSPNKAAVDGPVFCPHDGGLPIVTGPMVLPEVKSDYRERGQRLDCDSSQTDGTHHCRFLSSLARFSSPVAINLLIVVIGTIRALSIGLADRLLIIAVSASIRDRPRDCRAGLVHAFLLLGADRRFSTILGKNRIKRRRCQQERDECNDAHDEQIPWLLFAPL